MDATRCMPACRYRSLQAHSRRQETRPDQTRQGHVCIILCLNGQQSGLSKVKYLSLTYGARKLGLMLSWALRSRLSRHTHWPIKMLTRSLQSAAYPAVPGHGLHEAGLAAS